MRVTPVKLLSRRGLSKFLNENMFRATLPGSRSSTQKKLVSLCWKGLPVSRKLLVSFSSTQGPVMFRIEVTSDRDKVDKSPFGFVRRLLSSVSAVEETTFGKADLGKGAKGCGKGKWVLGIVFVKSLRSDKQEGSKLSPL